jgi:hypothetical protein
MSFDTHYAFDPPHDLTLNGQTNGIPSMFTCFDYQPVEAVPEGRDCVVVIGKRNHRAIVDHIAERARRAVVIVCPGDKPFDNRGQPIPDNILRIFTTNRIHPDPRVTSVPIGVRSSKLQLMRYARRHRPRGDHRDRALLYLNFTIGTRYDVPAERRGLSSRRVIAGRLRGEEWVTDRVSAEAVKGEGALFKYLTDVMQHKFVASPEGFGIDCYRHWESLYLGAIPIVQRSEHMESFSDLPILFTDDFTEISEPYLKDVYEQYCSRTFDFSKLYGPYYTRMLVEAASELEDPEYLLLLSDEEPSGWWPAQGFLGRLSRFDGPYRHGDLLRAGDLIPSNDYEHRSWEAMNGAQVSFDSSGAVMVEHASDSELVGAKLELRTLRGVTYRVHGEMRSTDGASPLPRLEVTGAQAKQVIYGQAVAVGAQTTIDFTFQSGKTGAFVQFRPGRSAMLDIKIEPVLDLIPGPASEGTSDG